MGFALFNREKQGDNYNVDWKHFYKQVFKLIIPMALQNLINVGVTAADVGMLGRVSESVLSGASLAGQVQFIMTMILFGTTSGITVLAAQYWGKRDTRTIEKIMGMGMAVGMGTAFVFTMLTQICPERLMQIYTSEPDVIYEGVKYLRIVGWSYLFMAMNQVYLYIMRSIERVVIATVVYTSSLVTNVVLNLLLIFGLMGFPKLGIVGAAIATLVSRIIEFGIVVWYSKFKNKVVKFRFYDVWHIDKNLFKDFVRYAAPVILNELLWGLGSSTNTAIIGHLGKEAVAANAVAQMTRQLASVVVFGVANATAIYLGKTIGEKKYDLAKLYGKKFAGLSVITGAAGGCVILLLAPILKHVMVLSPEAQEYLTFMFFVMSYFTFCMSVNSTLIVGVLRSGGDTKYGLIIDVAGMWCCSILCGAIAAFVFKASVPIVYMILMSDEVIKIPLSVKRFLSYKWINNVTRENEECT